MRQEERVRLSKERILKAAIDEFGTKSYENASINNICSDNGISKGLIYHYFGNKDELYLLCIKDCLNGLVKFMESREYDFSDFQIGMNQYIGARYSFFKKNPQLCYLFFSTFLQPPKHLILSIKELRTEFDEQCTKFYKRALSHITLRENISEGEAMEYFTLFQEMFNGYFQGMSAEGTDFQQIIMTHEAQLPKMLNMLLYGIAKEKDR